MKANSNQLRIIISIALTVFYFYGNAQKVHVDYDTNIDFKKYKTYSWLAPGDSVLNRYRSDKIYGGYIAYAANQELKAKGMSIDSLRPDAIFVFTTEVEEFTEYSQSPVLSVGVGVGGPGYYVAGSAPVAGGKITASTMENGRLSYSMYDTKSGKLVWSGWVESDFKMSDDIEQLIGEYTKKIFKKLPVKSK